MITPHTFGPSFGMPDGGRFVVEATLPLQFAGLDDVARDEP